MRHGCGLHQQLHGCHSLFEGTHFAKIDWILPGSSDIMSIRHEDQAVG